MTGTVNDRLESARRLHHHHHLHPSDYVDALSETVLDALGEHDTANLDHHHLLILATLAQAHATDGLRASVDDLGGGASLDDLADQVRQGVAETGENGIVLRDLADTNARRMWLSEPRWYRAGACLHRNTLGRLRARRARRWAGRREANLAFIKQELNGDQR